MTSITVPDKNKFQAQSLLSADTTPNKPRETIIRGAKTTPNKPRETITHAVHKS